MSAPSGARRTVLVTGAAGSLASRVISRLHGNHDVVAVDFRRRVETDAAISSYLVDMNRRGFEEIFRRHRIDAVIHIGRIFAHESSRARRYSANVLGTRSLLELSRKYGVKHFLLHSTYFVYGAGPGNPALLKEDAPLKASELTDELVDSVELENLAQIWLWKHPELPLTILRPCNILGPGVRNALSLLLERRLAPVAVGHAPRMQCLHVEDMADAILAAFASPRPGIYNVAPDEHQPYPEIVRQCGCRPLPLPPLPGAMPQLLARLLNWHGLLPPYLLNYLRYPALIDGSLFRDHFSWQPQHAAESVFGYYRARKQRAH